jgi:hypothetical protein
MFARATHLRAAAQRAQQRVCAHTPRNWTARSRRARSRSPSRWRAFARRPRGAVAGPAGMAAGAQDCVWFHAIVQPIRLAVRAHDAQARRWSRRGGSRHGDRFVRASPSLPRRRPTLVRAAVGASDDSAQPEHYDWTHSGMFSSFDHARWAARGERQSAAAHGGPLPQPASRLRSVSPNLQPVPLPGLCGAGAGTRQKLTAVVTSRGRRNTSSSAI